MYAFARERYGRRVWATKGIGGSRPIWPRSASRKNVGKVPLFLIGVDSAKELIYARLRIAKPGPAYLHFPDSYDETWFEQLTAEKIVTKYHRGFAYRQWVKVRPRNEALDVAGRERRGARGPSFDGAFVGPGSGKPRGARSRRRSGDEVDDRSIRAAKARAIRGHRSESVRRGRRLRPLVTSSHRNPALTIGRMRSDDGIERPRAPQGDPHGEVEERYDQSP